MTISNKSFIVATLTLMTFTSPANAVLGNSENFKSPAIPLPANSTPHDGVQNDGGWMPVDMCLAGATGFSPAQAPDCQHNDDDSSVLDLGFDFYFYGVPYTKVYINNNGNLSFGSLFSTFTSTGFPVLGFPMIAPFWADVDTGDQYDVADELGHVWYQEVGSNTLAVMWENVGYFSGNADKLNTFQVIISDGTNLAMGLGNNVCFAYDDMQWTTGDASDGFNGFGGTPATVGANKGDGEVYFQVGLFDHPGTDYDGPTGNHDGVDYLDGHGAGMGNAICFNATGTNTPPIPVGFPQNNIVTGICNETLDLALRFIAPEPDQTTIVAITDHDGAQAQGLSITHEQQDNSATVGLLWDVGLEDAGTYTLTLNATDDGSPVGENSQELEIVVDCPFTQVAIDIKPDKEPNPINRKSGGVIPVAILSSSDFNVSDIDLATLKFGTCGDETAPAIHPSEGHFEDVNYDGLADVVIHFSSQETHFASSTILGCVSGKLINGQNFVGTDSIKVVK